MWDRGSACVRPDKCDDVAVILMQYFTLFAHTCRPNLRIRFIPNSFRLLPHILVNSWSSFWWVGGGGGRGGVGGLNRVYLEAEARCFPVRGRCLQGTLPSSHSAFPYHNKRKVKR